MRVCVCVCGNYNMNTAGAGGLPYEMLASKHLKGSSLFKERGVLRGSVCVKRLLLWHCTPHSVRACRSRLSAALYLYTRITHMYSV